MSMVRDRSLFWVVVVVTWLALSVGCDPLVVVVVDDGTIVQCGAGSDGCTPSYECIANACRYGTVPMKGANANTHHIRCLPAPKVAEPAPAKSSP